MNDCNLSAPAAANAARLDHQVGRGVGPGDWQQVGTIPLGAALGRETKTPDTKARGQGRHGRYASKNKAAKLLRDVLPKAAKRLSECGYRPNDEVVQLRAVAGENRAFVGGVMVCGSVWLCPNCAARINEVRKRELDALLLAAKAAGKAVFMLTLTARHDRKTVLADFLPQMKGALDHLRTGRAWRALKVHGSVTATEVTHGGNGYHPHFHLLLLMDQPKGEAESLLAGLRAEWMRSLAHVGLTGNDAAFQLQDGTAAGVYVAKFGAAEEMTLQSVKQGRKGGRSPWQLLDDARDGDTYAGKVWAEYAVVFKGRRQLVWSKSLKERYGIEETCDAEAAEAEAARGEVVVLRTWLAKGSWIEARRRICAILEAAENGGDLDAAEAGPTDAERWRPIREVREREGAAFGYDREVIE